MILKGLRIYYLCMFRLRTWVESAGIENILKRLKKLKRGCLDASVKGRKI